MKEFFKNFFKRTPLVCGNCGVTEDDLKLNPVEYEVVGHNNIALNEIGYKDLSYEALCEKCYSIEIYQIFSSKKHTHRLVFCDTCPNHFVVKKRPTTGVTTCKKCKRHRLQQHLI